MSTQHWRSSVAMQARARQLRKEMTPAERKLWQHIRRGQLDGAHFRRQHAVGPFIVDFFCARANLVIEIDGDSHAGRAEYDAERTRWLEQHKEYRVIRFTNNDVFRNIEGVVEKIREALQPPSPTARFGKPLGSASAGNVTFPKAARFREGEGQIP